MSKYIEILSDIIPDYTPSKPDWCYSYLNIPNLDQIKQEMLYLYNNVNPGFQANAYYVHYLRNDIIQYCPTLCNYLIEMGVYDKLSNILASSKSLPEGFPVRSRIHVDAYDKKFTHSINIPLVDCDNTYTAWYTGPLRVIDKRTNTFVSVNQNLIQYFYVIEDGTETEICRAETNRPMIINTSIPHRGLHNCPTRILAGIRFLPDLTDEEFNRITTV